VKGDAVMKTRKLFYTIIISVAVAGAIAALAFYAIFFKSHRSVENEQAISVTAVQLFSDFVANEQDANKRYLDKAVEVTGKITEITSDMERHTVVELATDDILFGVRCTLLDSQTSLQPGDTVRIKGICKGFLSDVIITNGILNQEYEK
jgi:hypothetical protein